MRVIAGEAKGHPLRAPKGEQTRPTADKIKGAIFSMIESVMMSRQGGDAELWEGRRVLDLYAGSGALGIESLSRGASWADFVDSGGPACRAIRDNLERTKLSSRANVHCVPVRRALAEGYKEQLRVPYDVVLLDPPYADPTISQVMEELGSAMLVRPEGVVVVEHSRRVSLSGQYGSISLVKSRRHGDTCVSIYESRSMNL